MAEAAARAAVRPLMARLGIRGDHIKEVVRMQKTLGWKRKKQWRSLGALVRYAEETREGKR